MKKNELLVSYILIFVLIIMLSSSCITIVVPENTSESPQNKPYGSYSTIAESEKINTEPIIYFFTANPDKIKINEASLLSWNVSNATSVYIDQGIGSVDLNGSITVSPKTTTVYSLTASNTKYSKISNLQIVVSPEPIHQSTAEFPIIHSFNASPETILTGESAILNWSVSNASTVLITNDENQSFNVTLTGNAVITPKASTTYTLKATNSIGKSEAVITVKVFPPPAITQHQSWEGTWDTNWGTMHLSQSEGKVTGVYEHDNGKIIGYISKNLTGDTLIGTWSEAPSYLPPEDAGDIEWVMSPDFKSFSGKWRYGSSGEWDGTWKGTRL